MAIRIPIQAQRIFIFSCIAISRNKSTSCRIIIPSSQINRTRFRIVVFSTIPERIRIRVIDILLHTERIIGIGLGNFTCRIGQIHHITMCILRIVGIPGLFAVMIALCCNQICASQVAIRTVKLAVQHIRDKLSIAVPDVLCRFTIDSFAQPQAIHIIGIACSRFAIGKANQLIQTYRFFCAGVCDRIDNQISCIRYSQIYYDNIEFPLTTLIR